MKQNIDKLIQKNLKQVLNEYYDRYYMNPLRKYFQQSENDEEWNDNETIHCCYYFFPKWLSKSYQVQEELNDLIENNELQEDWDNDIDDWYGDEVLEFINKYIPEFKHDFVEYCDYHAERGDDGMPPQKDMSYIGEFKNKWLIHFTPEENIPSLWKQGFSHGIDDIYQLSYTGNCGDPNGYHKAQPGYNFAYDVNEVDYAFTNHGWRPKYGDTALLFQASGIKADHYGDQEPQCIFYGPSTKNIIILERDHYNEEWCVKSEITNQILMHSENIQDLAYWCINNFDQYRKHLLGKINQNHRFKKNNKKNYYNYL